VTSTLCTLLRTTLFLGAIQMIRDTQEQRFSTDDSLEPPTGRGRFETGRGLKSFSGLKTETIEIGQTFRIISF